MAQIPRGLVGRSDQILEQVRRHPLAGLGDQIDRQEPLVERQMGVLEHRADCDGELASAQAFGAFA